MIVNRSEVPSFYQANNDVKLSFGTPRGAALAGNVDKYKELRQKMPTCTSTFLLLAGELRGTCAGNTPVADGS